MPNNDILNAMEPIRVIAAVITNDNGEVLLVRKRSSAIFMQPGGKPEPGEAPLMALTRELDEELGVGIDVENTVWLGEFEAVAANEAGRTVRAQTYLCSVQGVVRAQAEIDETVWVKPVEPYCVPVAPLSANCIIPAYLAAIGEDVTNAS